MFIVVGCCVAIFLMFVGGHDTSTRCNERLSGVWGFLLDGDGKRMGGRGVYIQLDVTK